MPKLKATLLALLATSCLSCAAHADVTLNLVASYDRSGAFGLAFDGTNMWWSDSSGNIHEMTTNGVDTGNVITGTSWSALAYNSNNNRIVIVENNGITQYQKAVGVQSGSSLDPIHTNIAGGPNVLTDGLDIQGNTLWWSPDVSAVYNSPLDGSGSQTTFLPQNGGYSGVEQVTVGSKDYVFVVNDGFQPRELCYSGSASGCVTLPNSRYEDLAFDGRYLWAADFYGNRIDKIDLLGDDGSILTSGVPEPSTWAMLVMGFAGVGFLAQRRRKRSALTIG